MAELDPKRPRRPSGARKPGGPPKPENLVEEIVDQITRKQARAIREAEPSPGAPRSGAACREDLLAGTPYRAVLGCASDRPGT